MKPTVIKVCGEEITVNRDKLMLIKDVSRDMDRIASLMSYWGEVWAAAESERIEVDAYYRQWRAGKGMEIAEAEPKLAEWKVKQRIEESEMFYKLKQGIAAATRNATIAKTTYESLKTKASMLQSKGAMMRAEMDSTGMHTPEKPSRKRSEKEADREEKAAQMRELNRKKKKKKKRKA